MNLIHTIIKDIGPISSTELLDYLNSDLFYKKGYFTHEEWTRSKIQYRLDKLTRNFDDIFKFKCKSGLNARYGISKFKTFLSEEFRFLEVKGYLKRCMYCGIPIYIQDEKIFHFKFKCEQFFPQSFFKLLKVDDFWAILSENFIFGILEDFQSCSIRLPGNFKSKAEKDILTEFWLINTRAKEQEIINKDQILKIYAEERLI